MVGMVEIRVFTYSTGVISRICENEPPTPSELNNVATRWVGEAKRAEMRCHAELAVTAAKDIAVVAVKMDRVGDGWCAYSLLYDPVSPSGCRC